MSRPLITPQTLRRLAAAAAVGVAALSLTACISLLPKTAPVQLYRFGAKATGEAAAADTGGFGVLKPPSTFQREASGDRLLTTNGASVAYIGEARWVSAASVLFDEAVGGAFAAHNGPAHLVGRGDPRHSDYTLKLDVRSFEAQYVRGEKSPPDVVVTLDAALAPNDRSLPRQHTFEVRVAATDNRVSAIVEAYNQALSQLLPQLVAWVDAAGPGRD